jgi:hypothetical protein
MKHATRISDKKKTARRGFLSGSTQFRSSHERAVITPPALKVGSRARRQCLARSPGQLQQGAAPKASASSGEGSWPRCASLGALARTCPATRLCVRPRPAQLHPTARRLPVKAKPSGWRSAPLRCAPALTWPPAWAVTGCVSRTGLAAPIRWPGLGANSAFAANKPPPARAPVRLTVCRPAATVRTVPDLLPPLSSRFPCSLRYEEALESSWTSCRTHRCRRPLSSPPASLSFLPLGVLLSPRTDQQVQFGCGAVSWGLPLVW